MLRQLAILSMAICTFLLMSCSNTSSEGTAKKEDPKWNSAEGNPIEMKKKKGKKQPGSRAAADQIQIGEAVPMADLKLAATDGKTYSINDVKGENGVLVMFSCNTCPYVVAWEDRFPKVAEVCKEKNIGLYVVNSNEAKREGDDSMDAMKAHAEKMKYDFPYVVDTDHQLADAIGAMKTPDLFLFDKDLKLVYKGAIDDNHKSTKDVEHFYVKNAIGNLTAGQPIDPNSTKAIGCTIKRTKKL